MRLSQASVVWESGRAQISWSDQLPVDVSAKDARSSRCFRAFTCLMIDGCGRVIEKLELVEAANHTHVIEEQVEISSLPEAHVGRAR
jgi:hypothetical protein